MNIKHKMSLMLFGIGVSLVGLFAFRKKIQESISDFRDLFTVVRRREDNDLSAFIKSLGIVRKMYWLRLLHYLNNNIEHVNSKRMKLTYTHNGKIYRIAVNVRKGPCPILNIIDEEGKNVTQEVLPYMGPAYDFHGQRVTPSICGRKKLIFETIHDSYLFEEHDEIIIPE